MTLLLYKIAKQIILLIVKVGSESFPPFLWLKIKHLEDGIWRILNKMRRGEMVVRIEEVHFIGLYVR